MPSPVSSTDETSHLFDVFTYHTPFFSDHNTSESQGTQGLPRTQAGVTEGGPALCGQSFPEQHIRLKLYFKHGKEDASQSTNILKETGNIYSVPHDRT